MSLKIGILEADHVVEHLRVVHGSYPEMFTGLLQGVDPDIVCDSFAVIDGEYPGDLRGYDGFLITGSRYSAYDSETWVAKLIAYVKNLYKARKPLVGICFGHQIIAQALDGAVERARQGWAVGASKSRLYYRPQWMKSLPANNEFTLLVSHQDQVVKLPKHAALLAGSSFCPNAMYQLGETILTFQGHPEFSKAYCLGLMDMRRGQLGEAVYKEGVKSLNETSDSDLIARWIVEFFLYNKHH
ncbi:MAG: amidotransferase [Ketobacteraceae bacterium]|nr:amidotransferase [Ketobacteraceae bacterium]